MCDILRTVPGCLLVRNKDGKVVAKFWKIGKDYWNCDSLRLDGLVTENERVVTTRDPRTGRTERSKVAVKNPRTFIRYSTRGGRVIQADGNLDNAILVFKTSIG